MTEQERVDDAYFRKIARAKRIFKIQRSKKRALRRRNIDRFIKDRVYMISVFLTLFILILVAYINRTNDLVKEQTITMHYSNDLIDNLAKDKMFVMNKQLAKAVDSLQILIFVYHRRHMKDQAQIQAQINGDINREKLGKSNKLEFPHYLEKDTVEYGFTLNEMLINENNKVSLDTGKIN